MKIIFNTKKQNQIKMQVNIESLKGQIIQLWSGTYKYKVQKVWFGTDYITREPAILADLTQVNNKGIECKSKIYTRKNFVIGDVNGLFID